MATLGSRVSELPNRVKFPYKNNPIMSMIALRFVTVVSFIITGNLNALPQVQPQTQICESEMFVLKHLPDWQYTTKAYRDEACRFFLEEANDVAKKLNLSEQLPITRSNLIEIFISPPALGSLGSISTSNYAYYCTFGRAFSGLVQRNQARTFNHAIKEFKWPIARINTNNALKVATQLLDAVGMDTTALNRDCSVEVIVFRPEEIGAAHFVPDYWITWRKPNKVVAFIEFIEPTRSIRQISVWDYKYILRTPIVFTNLAELLSTNAPALTNAPLPPR